MPARYVTQKVPRFHCDLHLATSVAKQRWRPLPLLLHHRFGPVRARHHLTQTLSTRSFREHHRRSDRSRIPFLLTRLIIELRLIARLVNEITRAISFYDLQEFHLMTNKSHFMTCKFQFMTEPTTACLPIQFRVGICIALPD